MLERTVKLSVKNSQIGNVGKGYDNYKCVLSDFPTPKSTKLFGLWFGKRLTSWKTIQTQAGKSSALRRSLGVDPISLKNACLISSTATYFHPSKSVRVGGDCVLCLTFVILSDKCYRRDDQRIAEEVPLGRGSPGVTNYCISSQCEF